MKRILQNKTLIIVFLCFALLGGIFVFIQKRNSLPQNSGVISLPQNDPRRSTSDALIPIETPASTEGFYLIKTNPEKKVLRSIWGIEPLDLYFSEAIDPTSVSIQANPDPDIQFEILETNPTVLSIFPMEGWRPGFDYEITVSKQLRSKSGKTLTKDIVFTFTSFEALPGDPEYPEPLPEEHFEQAL